MFYYGTRVLNPVFNQVAGTSSGICDSVGALLVYLSYVEVSSATTNERVYCDNSLVYESL